MRCGIVLSAILGLLFPAVVDAADVGLKISSEKEWTAWGDYILGQDLKAGIESFDFTVQPAYIGNYYPSGSSKTKIDIYMHGFVPFNPPINDNKINVLYLYYPLETAHTFKYKNLKDIIEPSWYSLQTELWDFDLIAVASPTYQKEIEKLGIKTIFAPQFTNSHKFFYEYDVDKAYDILFVGRPGYDRISARWAIESGFEVALFGNGWQDKAPKAFFKGDYIDNDELHKYYASAKIVLNDTREDMKKSGFISNRIFDVTASGGFLISDYMPEIEQFYGDNIPMFKTKEELAILLKYYLSHPEERAQKAKRAQEITLANFTHRQVAKRILSAVDNIQKSGTIVTDANKLVLKFPWQQNALGIGDYWLGKDLFMGLQQSGFEVKEYYYNNSFPKDDFYNTAENLLYMQFKYNYTDFEDEAKARIMYLYFPTFVPERGKFKNTKDYFIYNTDAALNNELEYFDLIATPAKVTLKKLKKYKYQSEFIPQFTNPNKFKYAPKDELKTDLLFVGSCWYERVSVLYALENDYDVAVYGLGWEGKIPPQYFKGAFIDNSQLHQYYSSAKIVLSDHADDLAEMGLVINRLYDASAVGTLVISKYSPYIEEIFGDSIPMFKNKEEFKQLVDFYLAHPEEREKKAKAAQKITLDGYTHQIIGEKFKKLFQKISKEKK
ncbi:MAG: glycosyltransferase [Acetobacter sp.]|nr:glycosyltransferase [Acetobacter sp.]